ncbi:hypothetical protein M758_12G111000 [Ceratodon purpureus]|nr:hypothetical protein M758_12G111000 [Ceratodon purpureus]
MYRNSRVVASYIRQIGRASHASAVECNAGFPRCKLPNATDSSTSLFPWNSKYSARLMGIHDPCSVEGIRHFRGGSEIQAGAPSEKPAVVQSTGGTGGPLLPATRGRQKPRVVILGSGWGACRLLKDINTLVFDVVCISPRNHMVFTPLLASTCVGTLEFRSVAEPVRKIQPALSLSPDSYYMPARCVSIDPDKHEVNCVTIYDDMPGGKTGAEFSVAYDKLVIATGAEASTFGIKGVAEYAIFLRDVKNARDIRTKLLLNLMLCEIPVYIQVRRQKKSSDSHTSSWSVGARREWNSAGN